MTYCQCDRPLTRAFLEAALTGQYCPSCNRQIDPSSSSVRGIFSYTSSVEIMDAEDVLRRLADSMSCIQVKPFSGDPKENFRAFLNKFDTFCQVHQRTEESKLNTFPLYLEGRAFEIYNMLSDEDKEDYDTLKTAYQTKIKRTTIP